MCIFFRIKLRIRHFALYGLYLNFELRIIFLIIFDLISFNNITSWQHHCWIRHWNDRYPYPTNICLFEINNRNTRKRCDIFLKLLIETPERRHWRRYGVFILLNLNIFQTFSYCFYCWIWLSKCYLISEYIFSYLCKR